MSGVYSTREAFAVYQYYIAIKQHFTSDYDYFKYNGKVNVSPSSFEIRRDKFIFYKLSKRKDWQGLILANFIADRGKKWIGDLDSSEAESIYNEWLKRKQSLGYLFKSELSQLRDDFESNFRVDNGQHPYLLERHLQGKISLETMVIIDDLLNIIPNWNKKISLQIIWEKVRYRMIKYKPFLQYDKSSMRKIMLDYFG
jgi:hypothetical protein